MPPPPHFHYGLSQQELSQLGELSLTWSHIEHLIGHSVKAMLGLTDDQAVEFVYSASADRRMQMLKRHSLKFSKEIQDLTSELNVIMKSVFIARNTTIHAVIIENWDIPKFRLLSKGRTLLKEDVFGIEQITNYAALLALHIIFKLNPDEFDLSFLPPLPDRPDIPAVLLPEGQRNP